jgi:hypothetical protein
MLVDGIDDDAATRSLRILEDEGGDVIPSVPDRLDATLHEADRRLSELFLGATPTQEQARFEAIALGGEVTFLVPAFPLALADLAVLHRLEEEGRPIRVVVAVPAELPDGRRQPDPLHELFLRLRRSGVSTSECPGPLRHGMLICGPHAFIAHYGVGAIATRPGRGVPRVEVRLAASAAVPALRDLLAHIAGERRQRR